MASPRVIGVTVLADFILSEGVEAVVQNLVRSGVTDVATNPTVTAPAREGEGTFQPPSDAGTSPREFDRPLFGKRALWVKSAPSYHPNAEHYRGVGYGPRATQPLTDEHGALVAEFIHRCQAEGIRVVFQLGAVQPTKLRDEDRPRQVDGTVAPKRMADTGSLACHAIREYNAAYVRDLVEAYPTIDGIRIDWPEYPCYTAAELLHDFSPHVSQWLEERGKSLAEARSGVERLIAKMRGGVSNAELAATRGHNVSDALAILAGDDGGSVRQWLAWKADLSTDLIAAWRDTIDQGADTARRRLTLNAHAFMPPYTFVTGFDFSRAAQLCDSVSPKLYTMHWPLMVQFWRDWLLANNPELEHDEVTRTVATWMELGTPDEIEEYLSRYRYPEPNEAHPVSLDNQRKKLVGVRQAIPSDAGELVPLVHGYGPVEDFAKRLRVVWESEVDGVWINRYGYLSDEKLLAVQGLRR